MKRPEVVAIFILALTAPLVVILEKEPAVSRARHHFARRIPLQLGEWKGQEIPLDEETVKTLGTDDMLMRHYANDKGEMVIFAAVFAKDNRRAVHAPMVCYKAQGWAVQEKGVSTYGVRPPASGYIPVAVDGDESVTLAELEPIPSFGDPVDLTFMELVIRSQVSGTWRVVHYWYKSGPSATHSLVRHELNMLLNRLFLRGSSNSLLRVSCDAASGSKHHIQAARETVRRFCRIVYPYVVASLP